MTTAKSAAEPPQDVHTVDRLLAERVALLDDMSVGGVEFCRRLSDITDGWVATLASQAAAQVTDLPAFAVLAVGGYGRGELAPYSDIDLIVVHHPIGGLGRAKRERSARLAELVNQLWYPIWDAGLKLGHAVRTVDEQLSLLGSDLDTATSMLSTRLIFGDGEIADTVRRAATQNWTERSAHWIPELRDRVFTRERDAGDVAYVLEPDLKDGHGGLRDAHSIWWGSDAGLALTTEDRGRLRTSYDALLGVRVALHRASGRANEVLRLDLQDNVAEQLGTDADSLMANVSAAGRHLAWLSEETWAVRGSTWGAPTRISPNVWIVDGEIVLDDEADVAVDPSLLLRVATAAARHRLRISRATLDRLSAEIGEWPRRWPAGALNKLVALLLEGHAAIPVIESLDQQALITEMLPEWAPNRSRPQRNAYHRFTVDRHLWEAAANAAELTDMVSRPDLLVLGALFHDIGKGYVGDHSVVGAEMVAEMGPRLGLNARDTEVVMKMVRHHLLLPDVAQRRDVSDPTTIEFVAERVGSVEVLELLHALTIADSKATGPSAWSDWKEELVADLVGRVSHVVSGGNVEEVAWTLFPDAATLELMAAGELAVDLRDDDRIIVVYVDLPGALYRIAGALSLHGLDVVTARSHSDQPQLGRVAMAAAEFRVEIPDAQLGGGGVDWDAVRPDVERALVAQLAIDARLSERAHTYRKRRRTLQAAEPVEPSVRFNDGASSDATVIEVRAATRMGILYAITKALANTGCDIRHANVQTVGSDAYDTFYVRNWRDELVTDPSHRAEIVRAVLFAISQG